MGTITERAQSVVYIAHDLVRLSAHHLVHKVVLADRDAPDHNANRPLAMSRARRVADILSSYPSAYAPAPWAALEVVLGRPAGILGLLDFESGRRTQRRRKALQCWEDHLGRADRIRVVHDGARCPAKRR